MLALQSLADVQSLRPVTVKLDEMIKWESLLLINTNRHYLWHIEVITSRESQLEREDEIKESIDWKNIANSIWHAPRRSAL